ncbi:MAG: TRAP transporter small permease [Alphaproteobacteria bacterium]|nr:TRAP transporter small permease [Alphaproteobacteria bacterium]
MADLFERLEWLAGRFNWATLGLFRWLLIAILVVMTGIVVAGVFFRYVLNDALPWSEEIAKFFMVWMTFLAAPVGLSWGSHVAIEALSSYIKGRLRQALQAVIFLLVICLMVVFVDEGLFLTWNARIQRHSTVDLSILYVYVAMPIGCAATAFVALEYMLGAIKGVFDPSRVKERTADYPMME